jgi:hypothetical protein
MSPFFMRLPLVAFAVAAALLSQERPATPAFSDEFDGRELDLTRWIPHDPFGAAQSPAAAEISNGRLRLNGTIATFSLFSQIYGRFEIRCRMPPSRGARVEVRLLPVHLGTLPAIDLFTAGTNGASRIFFANHWGTEQTERSYGNWFDAPDLSAEFHTVAVDWGRNKISWSLDGKSKFQSVDGVPQQPMFLEIGSQSPDGAPLEVDYVRIYPLRDSAPGSAR